MLEQAKKLQGSIMKAQTAETRKRTSVLSWMTESENHTEGAEPNDAISKDNALRTKLK